MITIADGVTYEPKAADRGRPAGTIHAKGARWRLVPYLAPVEHQGHVMVGNAVVGTNESRKMGISKRVWLLMQQADRDLWTATHGGSRIDAAAVYEANEATRLANKAANEARITPALTERQIAEREWDQRHNEGGEGYNPHRHGDRPTYWRPEPRRERHHPEGA